MTFAAVVCSHANPRGLTHLLGNLRYQTRPPDETIVLCSDTPDVPRLAEQFQDVEFLERPNRSDWGHEKRAEGLDRAASDWIGWFNDDDSYSRLYIATMLAAAGSDVGAVYCDWNLTLDSEDGFRLGRSTSGNFIVRRTIALQAGYTERVYEADGLFIDRIRQFCAECGLKVRHVPTRLYQHNRQPWSNHG